MPAEVFAVIDDLPQTAKWLPPCVSLEKVGDGPSAEGDALRYAYR
jgi:carbon monoxide dehydrogenase subunit G